VARVDPNQPIARTETMPARIATALAPRRFDFLLLGAFAVSAFLLATVGVYGVVAFAMAARTREIGVRMALGAAPRQIARLAAQRGAGPMAAGVITGAGASWLLARVLGSFVFGVTTRDGWSLLAAVIVVAGGALIAVAVPARRAMRIDPVIALRDS
jgi:ABC-type antimicrobial peptide transport system permease subunit